MTGDAARLRRSAQPRRQRHQVHGQGRICHRGRAWYLAGRDRLQGARHRHRHSGRAASSDLSGFEQGETTPRQPPAAPGLALRSRADRWSAWAGRSASRARLVRARCSSSRLCSPPPTNASARNRPLPISPAKTVLIVSSGRDRGAADRAPPRAMEARKSRSCRTPTRRPPSARAALGRADRRSCAWRRGSASSPHDRENDFHRIVLITPPARSVLPGLKEAGFNNYLVKPVRAVSLAARLGAADDPKDNMLARVEDDTSIVPDQSARRADCRSSSPRTMRSTRFLARALLAKLGHRPVVAANGLDALEFLFRRARGRNAVRSCVDGRAHARHRRPRGGAPHPCGRGEKRARAYRSSRSPPTPTRSIARRASPPGWTASSPSRSTASD